MKKKLLILMLITVCIFGLIFAGGCDLFKPTDTGVTDVPENPEEPVIPPEDDDPLTPPDVIPEHKHNYVWIISQKPSEGAEGQTANCCQVCKDVKEFKSLPALEHWSKTENKPTCEAAGRIIYTTKAYGIQYSFSVTVAPAGHSYGEWKISRYPTNGTQGSAKCACTVCGNEKTLTLPEFSKWQKINDTATCTRGGRATLTLTIEDASFSVEAATPALGHKWGEWQIDVPTCTQKGQKYRVCENDPSHREVAEELPISHDFHQKYDEAHHWTECDKCGLVLNETAHTLKDFKCSGCPFVSKSANLVYELNASGTAYAVTGRLDDKITDIVVPETYNSKPVEIIAESAFAGKKIGDIKLPSTFRKICLNAFSGAQIEGEADISGVTAEEGAFAFASVNALVISEETSIGQNAFKSATLEKLYFSGSPTQWNAYRQTVSEGNDAVKSPKALSYICINESGCKRHICDGTDRPLHDGAEHWFVCGNEGCGEVIFREEHTYNAGGSCIICGEERP